MLQSIVLCFVLFSAISFSYCFHIHRSFTSVKRSLKVVSLQSNTILYSKKITPSQDFRNMDEYRKAVMDVLKSQATDKTKLGGRELLELIIRKWGVAYDIQLRKSAPFGEGSANIYVNVMWRYFGQKTFPMNEKQYLEHLEAIGRYITAIGKVSEFKEKITDSRKRPNAYFGYAVPFSLDVDPASADEFFKDLPYD